MSERMINQFMEMVQIDSESGNEKTFHEYLEKEFVKMGGKAFMDDYGNLVGKFEAKGCEGKDPILFSCHGDTVKPGVGIVPVIVDGVIKSKGDTILGADDKAGIAEVLEAIRTAPVYPPLEFAVSRQEEVGLHGVKNLDFSLIEAKYGFLMDNDTLDTIVIGGPSYWSIDVEITGKSAHAGMEPEKGINAIYAASKAISALKLGRLDEETTANVGVINGGIIRNGVPDKVTFLAECRSGNHKKGEELAIVMEKTIVEKVEFCGAEVEIVVNNLCKAVEIAEDAKTVKISQKALKTVGIDAKPVFITGFTDASIYNNKGIEMSVIGIGAENEHSTDEQIKIENMEKALKVIIEIMRICTE
jgi:tripeptide aminopeptidase